jgi:excisionase family DNA binding protein
MRSFEVADFGMSYAGLIHTAKQLAGMLNISPKTVFKLAKAGRIPSYRVGSAVRFGARHVIEWQRKQRR